MKLLPISVAAIAGFAFLISCEATRSPHWETPHDFELREYPALPVAATGSPGAADRMDSPAHTVALGFEKWQGRERLRIPGREGPPPHGVLTGGVCQAPENGLVEYDDRNLW